MKKLTRQEQKNKALKAYLEAVALPWEAYKAIRDEERKAYLVKCRDIDEQGEK